MNAKPRLDGEVPLDSLAGQAVALQALSRRVADLEHRLSIMKIIIGLVLAAKVLLVLVFLYVLFAPVIRSGGPARSISYSARPVSAV